MEIYTHLHKFIFHIKGKHKGFLQGDFDSSMTYSH